VLSNRTMPTVAVIPELCYDDVESAVEWICRVFGFRIRWTAGSHRAQLAYRDGALIVAEGTPGDPESHEVMVRVPDADAHHAHSAAEGARIRSEPKDYPYGERQYSALDLAGHRWTFSQSIADVAPEEWGGTSARN
jgi:uncharacterized glyoxalase superfamily protein PhnB